MRFFLDNLPSWKALVLGGPLGLAWSFAVLWFAGILKRRGVRTGYTRKLFHFAMFSTVAALQWRFGTSAVCLFGGMCTLTVLAAIWQGPGNVLYEALAREKDSPHRTFFILVPYFTTLVGGLAGNMLFGSLAVAGYLVTGLGDAIGEPVGTIFGKHPYRVPSLASVPATRTLEGSAAVFLLSTVALVLAVAVSKGLALSPVGGLKLLAIAGVNACTTELPAYDVHVRALTESKS